MILYEVTLDVLPELAESLEAHMRQIHIPEIFATGCFQRIRFCRSSSTQFRTSYEARTAAELERYLQDHAPALRSAFTSAFPRGVSLSRNIWHEREVWGQVLS
jgi:Domain of unknown function (DUF4286)